jgi:hypothetical protein
MTSNDYVFFTSWRVRGALSEAAAVLGDALELPRWWPSVYLDVREVRGPDASGKGRVIELFTKGFLPYTLLWRFEVVENAPPHRFVLEAQGDFVGRGVWSLRQDGPDVVCDYDWRVRAEKPMLRRLSFALKPFFAANHRWAMKKGEESLALELRRRRKEQDVPPPPPATFRRLALLSRPAR